MDFDLNFKGIDSHDSSRIDLEAITGKNSVVLSEHWPVLFLLCRERGVRL
jgi:hypothetical protein